jgi:hypothetical protein
MTDQTSAIVTEGFFLAPAAAVNTVLTAYQAKKDLISRVMQEGVDYGPIPGSDKPALKKPGAEKLNTFFGLCPTFEDVETIEDWAGTMHGGEPFFYYRQRANLWKYVNGQRILIAAADGSCNSHETKYRYRWVGETEIPAGLERAKLKTRGGRISEFDFAVEKAETTGKYGKPAEYWQRFRDAIENGTATAIKRKLKSGQERDAWEIDSTLYRVPNEDISEQVNTVLKMAQKRALVAATLIATAASDYFTQDVDDFIDGAWSEPVTREQAAQQTAPQPGKNGNARADAILKDSDSKHDLYGEAKRGDMALDEAENLTTKKGTRLGDMSDEQLQQVQANANTTEKYRAAATLILNYRRENEEYETARMNGLTEEG